MPLQEDLTRYTLTADPFESFQNWFANAVQAKLHLPEAVTLATSSKNGRVNARMVLFKALSQNRFLFFTNYNSVKSKELIENPFACLVFYWGTLERQIRICGTVDKTSEQESKEYFKTRPRGSQISAWTSSQSQQITSRHELVTHYQEIEKKFDGKEIPCPPFWGGFRLDPIEFEFWHGRPDRLHDRFQFKKNNDTWQIARLAP